MPDDKNKAFLLLITIVICVIVKLRSDTAWEAWVAPQQHGGTSHNTAAAAAADGWRLGSIPNPYEQKHACGLEEAGGLCDPDGILSPEARVKVVNVMLAIRADTSVKCPDGSEKSFEVAAALVQRMHPDDWVSDDKKATTKVFAQELGDRWGIGDPGCSNGVLLFLSIQDRFAYIKTAVVSQTVMTDSLSEMVIDNLKPLLKGGQYDDALLQAVLQINDVLKGKSIPGSKTTWFSMFRGLIRLIPFVVAIGVYLLPILAMIVVFVLRGVLTPVAWLLDYVTNLCGQRQAELDLRRVQTELERSEFDQTMCPICLEQFATSGHAGCTVLGCRHKFHNACIEPWVNQHTNCPLCRADVDGPIAPEDESRPQDYLRRLRFYLSRLQYRHPR